MEIAAQKMIIALDDLDLDSALKMVELTTPFANTFKIGLSLFTAHGPEIVSSIKSLGVDVFLDLKLHDIPMQVAKAVENALVLEPRFLTLHASGGRAMMKEAAMAAKGSSTTLLAVSVLTSLNELDFLELQFKDTIAKTVSTLTELAFSSMVRGFVCSPHEALALRKTFGNDAFLVCPGIRSSGGEMHDQSRTMSAQEAILAGADCLVVGRPITKAANIVDAARAINREIVQGLLEMNNNRGVLWQ